VIIRNSQNVTIRDSEIGPCDGNAIQIDNSGFVNVWDNYIHTERRGNGTCSPCDIGDGIHAFLSNDFHIQGNVFAYNETHIEVNGVRNALVKGNFFLNPLGPFPRGSHFQSWAYGTTRSADITVEDNYGLSSKDTTKYKFADGQTDAFNFGFTDRAIARRNYVTGGTWAAGCGIIADASANSIQMRNNDLVQPGGCALSVASGTNNVIDGNRAYQNGSISGAGNTSISVWKQYLHPCGPTTVTNNIATHIRSDGYQSGFWDGGGCGPVTLDANMWNEAARAALEATNLAIPPPSIPPIPYRTIVSSPWTTR
jgi:hypothetical protein